MGGWCQSGIRVGVEGSVRPRLESLAPTHQVGKRHPTMGLVKSCKARWTARLCGFLAQSRCTDFSSEQPDIPET